MLDLKPFFFVMCRSTAHFLFYGARAQKPSAEMKRSFRGRIAHALFCFGFWKRFIPKYRPAVRERVFAVSRTKTARKQAVFLLFWSRKNCSGKQLFY